ncbi:MAG: hypothetical protein ACJ75R_08380 [Solirubrobacterales bacterium]
MSLRALQLTLLVVAAAAIVVMADLFATGVRLGCLALVVAGTWLTADQRHGRGGGWWILLAIGAALSVLGLAISWPADTAGGIVAVVGAALVLIAATIGFPIAD